jgi:hypothetical protein
MTNMENIKKPAGGERRHSRFSSQDNRQNIIQMRTSTTNRFLTKTLRTLCCVGALTACSAWATVVTWQLNPGGTLGSSKDSSQSGYTTTARGFGDTASIDASHQYSFRASESTGASETSSAFDDTLKNKTQVSLTSSPDESLLFAASNTPTRSATELDEAMTKTFDEEFVSVPTVQFASTASAAGAPDASGASLTSGPGPMPVPEMSALFPIVGLIAAVSCTQILRRRRAAQQSASRIVG